VIVYKPIDKEMSDDTIEKCWKANNDGCGFMYPTRKGLRLYKNSKELNPVLREYKKLIKDQKSVPVIWHFRIATVGSVKEENTQPFIGDKYGWAHNGTISKISKYLLTDESDTLGFGRMFLNGSVDPFNPNTKILLEDFLGYNKVVIMNKNGEVTILNEASGSWNDGIWFSNQAWKTTTYYTYPLYDNEEDNTTQSTKWSKWSRHNNTSRVIVNNMKIGKKNGLGEGYNIWSDEEIWDEDANPPRYIHWSKHSDTELVEYCRNLFKKSSSTKSKNKYFKPLFAAKMDSIIDSETVDELEDRILEESLGKHGLSHFCFSCGSMVMDKDPFCEWCKRTHMENAIIMVVNEPTIALASEIVN